VELVNALRLAFATIAVPLAPGAGNTPAKGTVAVLRLVEAFVTMTLETL
jgi:hypothetical protein